MNKLSYYRIRYLNSSGIETTPDRAVIFRVFKNGEYVKEFFPLSAANAWIADQRHRELFPKMAALLDTFEKEQAIKAGQKISP
jgi:hypothetical protein